MQESTAAENARRRRRTLNPLFLAVSLEAGGEQPTAENARWRQRTLYPPCLVGGSGIEERLERSTVENSRQRQRTLYLLVSSKALVVLGSGAGSVSQTQRIRMLAGERSEVSLKRASFYIKENACSMISGAFRINPLFVYPCAVFVIPERGSQ